MHVSKYAPHWRLKGKAPLNIIMKGKELSQIYDLIKGLEDGTIRW
jgi:hypothetical protein